MNQGELEDTRVFHSSCRFIRAVQWDWVPHPYQRETRTQYTNGSTLLKEVRTIETGFMLTT